jgi:hypothetical protein
MPSDAEQAPPADPPDPTLRDEIKSVLSEAGAFCGECGFKPGDIGCPDCQRCHNMYADAVIAKLRATDRLIDRGRIFRVVETDWTDGNDENQTFTVYTAPTEEMKP